MTDSDRDQTEPTVFVSKLLSNLLCHTDLIIIEVLSSAGATVFDWNIKFETLLVLQRKFVNGPCR